MYLNNIPAGDNFPEDLYVIIEIPAYSHSIKYEINKNNGVLYVNRLLTTSMVYPCNYGYINQTLSLDGDPLDTLVITPQPIQSKSVILCRPLGMLNMIDDSGEDLKLIAVPHSKLTTEYDSIQDIKDLPKKLCDNINHFFNHYKDLEKNKWTKILGWKNLDQTKQELMRSYERAQQ
ncbi:MAG: inorganic diphosphatase [Candidatus Dasytiphilus stammeri]